LKLLKLRISVSATSEEAAVIIFSARNPLLEFQAGRYSPYLIFIPQSQSSGSVFVSEMEQHSTSGENCPYRLLKISKFLPS